MTLKRNTTPVIAASDPAITTNTLQSPFESVGNGLRSAQTGNTPPVRCALVNTNSSVYSECGSVYQTCINRSTTNQYVQCSISTLNVGLTNSSNIYCNVLPGIERLAFDTDSGFDVTDIGNATAKIGMNSTFKCWNVNGNPGLVAVGLDTVNFIAGSGINITSDNTLVPKTFTISSTGGGGGTPGGCNTQVQFNNSGAFGASCNLTFCNTNCTLSVPNITNTAGTCLDLGYKVADVSQQFLTYVTNAENLGTRDDFDFTQSVVDSDGNTISIGVEPYGNLVYPLIVKISTTGQVIWAKKIVEPTNRDTYGQAIGIDSNNNLYITVNLDNTINSVRTINGTILKLDPTASSIIWQNQLDISVPGVTSLSGLTLGKIVVDTSFNVYISYDFAYFSVAITGVGLIKLDSAGVLQWQRTRSLTGYDYLYSNGLCLDNSENIIWYTISSYNYLLITKFNPNGNVLWQKSNTSYGYEVMPQYISVDSADNIYLMLYNEYILKLDSSGNKVAEYVLSGSSNLYYTTMRTDSLGNLYIAGASTTSPDLLTIFKLNSSFEIQWQKRLTFGNSSIDFFIDIFQNTEYNILNVTDQYIYVTGNTWYAGVLKVATNGTGNGTYRLINVDDTFTYDDITEWTISATTDVVLTDDTSVWDNTGSTLSVGIYTLSNIEVNVNPSQIGGTQPTTLQINNTSKLIETNFYNLPYGVGLYEQALVTYGNGCVKWGQTGYRPCSGNIIIGRNGSWNYGCRGSFYFDNPNDNSALGIDALLNITTGQNNTAIGRDSQINVKDAYGNTGVGSNTLSGIVCGSYNTAIGMGAMGLTGDPARYNIGIGISSLYQTRGCCNIAMGINALSCNLSGNNNIAIGNNSNKCNVSGLNNIAIGNDALRCSKSGQFNVGIGSCTLDLNCCGCYNLAIGHGSARSLCTGNNNIAVGLCSMNNICAGSENIAIGNVALNQANSATNNIAIGSCALTSAFNSCRNIAIGNNAGGSALCNNSYNIFIGESAGVNSICCTNGNTHIGIGKFIPVTSCIGGTNNTYSVHLTSGVPSDCQSRLLINSMGAFINPLTDCNNSNTICSGGIWAAGLQDGSVGGSSTNIDWNLNKETIRYFNNVSNQLSDNFSITIRGDFFWPYLGLGGPENMIELRLVLTQSAIPIIPGSVYIQTKTMGLNGPFIQTLKWLNNSIPTPNANRIDVFIITLYNYGDNFVAMELKSY